MGGAMYRYFGLAICLFLIAGALVHVGPQRFFDFMALQIVLGGAVGYAMLKGNKSNFVAQFGNGAVYFGWLGTLIGVISICTGAFDIWGDLEKTGPALGIALLTVFYGYTLKLIAMTFSPQQ